MTDHTTEKAVIRRHLLPHATFGDDPSGWCACAGCEPSDKCGCPSCREVTPPGKGLDS